MPTYQAPGVHVQHVLTEPARVLQTGVPVFLGLVREEYVDALNAQQTKLEEVYAKIPLQSDRSVPFVRKQGYTELPGRFWAPSSDRRIPDTSSSHQEQYLRLVPQDQPTRTWRHQVRRSGGAAATPKPGAGAPSDVGARPDISAKPQRFTLWPQFELTFGDLAPDGFLTYAVRGFFENGGSLCYVQIVSYRGGSTAIGAALSAGLASLELYDDYDLVCVPDLVYVPDTPWDDDAWKDVNRVAELQHTVLEHCSRLGDRMAILDSVAGADSDLVIEQRRRLSGENGALYYPWVRVPGGPEPTRRLVPPCGHIAGVYARCDRRVGVHKAPANEILEGVLDLERLLNDEQQGPLNEQNINCLRAFPRRGIRVWGARTLTESPDWGYVNVRRVILTAARWIDQNTRDFVFEPQTPRLWEQIVRDLTAYFMDLARRGALYTPQSGEPFYVKCDAETNPPEIRESGMVVTEVGLQPPPPAEFLVIRIIHGPTGTRIVGPETQTTETQS